MSSLVIATRRGRDAGSGSGYSRISIVFGSMLPTLSVRNSPGESRDRPSRLPAFREKNHAAPSSGQAAGAPV